MKRVILLVVVPVLTLVGITAFVMTIFSVIEHSGRETAKSEILAAIDRMRSVNDFDDVDTLLSACESGALDQRIDCRLGDYDIVYRGHRIKFSRIEVGYYRPLHGVYDRDRGQYFPYMTGTARIERRPQVQGMTIGS
jgi:hypothetical protein